MGMMIPLLLALAAFSVQADVFDAWADDHNGDQSHSFLAPSVREMPQPAGRMEIAQRVWDGKSGTALAIYDQGGGRILPLYIAADTDAAGKATFIAWTTEPSATRISWWGQPADVVVTGVGIGFSGLVEGNPLLASTPALAAASVVKVAIMPVLKHHSIKACYVSLAPVGAFGYGAAGWGAVLITGAASGGILPAAAAGIAAFVTWPKDDEKFWSCVPHA